MDGIPIDDDVWEMTEEDDDDATLLHFPKPTWQPVPQYLSETTSVESFILRIRIYLRFT